MSKRPVAKHRVIAIDFDGTIVEEDFPEIGSLKEGAKETINYLHALGCGIIIWTSRDGERLEDVKKFLKENDIRYSYLNEPHIEYTMKYGNDPRKVGADIYIDDRSIFCNEINWNEIKEELIDYI